jgi:hypothetical protein
MLEYSTMNLNEIKVEYMISFSDALFALSIQLPNIEKVDQTRES